MVDGGLHQRSDEVGGEDTDAVYRLARFDVQPWWGLPENDPEKSSAPTDPLVTRSGSDHDEPQPPPSDSRLDAPAGPLVGREDPVSPTIRHVQVLFVVAVSSVHCVPPPSHSLVMRSGAPPGGRSKYSRKIGMRWTVGMRSPLDSWNSEIWKDRLQRRKCCPVNVLCALRGLCPLWCALWQPS